MDTIELAKEAIAAFEEDIDRYRKQSVAMPDELAVRAQMLVGLAQAEQLKRIADAMEFSLHDTPRPSFSLLE